MRPCLTVVIPIYNERATLAGLVQRVLAQSTVAEVIAVDDGSSDGSGAELERLEEREPRLRVFRHSVNRGKGAALRTGFAHASAEFVIVQDADLEYDPADYPVLLAPLLDGRADVVFGSRFAGAGAHRVLYFWHAVGNRFLTLLSNMATNLNLTDMETCYKAFRRDVLHQLHLTEDRFGIEPELTARVAAFRPQLRIYEVPISYHGRTYEDGKKIGWRDGVRALWCIAKFWIQESCLPPR
ncbi:MAG: glycosyltransferase family 2 protein [Candidatus Methylacidiphilales bacterium]